MGDETTTKRALLICPRTPQGLCADPNVITLNEGRRRKGGWKEESPAHLTPSGARHSVYPFLKIIPLNFQSHPLGHNLGCLKPVLRRAPLLPNHQKVVELRSRIQMPGLSRGHIEGPA